MKKRVTGFSIAAFYKELESSLANDCGPQRKAWAKTIINHNVDISVLSGLLKCDPKTAMHFRWLLSDVGLLEPKKLFSALPFLLEFFEKSDPAFKHSLANWWLIAGIPPKQESKAINLAFGWLQSSDTQVTTKSRSIWILQKLSKKYPEIKNELRLCLIDQKDKYSDDFRKRVEKVLRELEK